MTRFTSIVLAGEPNSGKSTLLNQLVGEKLSIVCHKAQTTRRSITGIFIYKDCQVLIFDTPGIFEKPKSALEKKIVKSALNTIKENEHIYLLVDAASANASQILDMRKKLDKSKICLLLNKADLASGEKIVQLQAELKEHFERIVPISALNGDGIVELKEDILAGSHESEWPFPEDEITTIPERELAADITREKLFFAVHQELPYELEVETEFWKDEKKIINISQVIYTKRESHKMIIIGRGGINIKNIGMQARKELEETLGKQVNLKLFVKVRPNWDDYL
jgi:GTP-binding protein Era